MAASEALVASPKADRAARFRAVFESEFQYVWTSLSRLGVPACDVEDVAQEVFAQVYAKLDAYEPTRPLRPWLFAFAFRCASVWRRRARGRREAVGEGVDTVPASGLAADESMERAEDLDLMFRALESVEWSRRAVLILYELDECPMKEIAESLRIPTFTGYSRLRVARREFATAFRRLRAQRERP
jgi:RNA polymerase sigma-70 factor (ECF subfamily)